MRQRPPLTPGEHIDQAKACLAEGASPQYAIAHALVAIAEIMATNVTDVILDATTRGAMATAEALGSVMSVLDPCGPATTEPGPCYVCQTTENVVAGWYCTRCAASGRR